MGCMPGIFGPYYQVDNEWNVMFLSSYFPLEENASAFKLKSYLGNKLGEISYPSGIIESFW